MTEARFACAAAGESRAPWPIDGESLDRWMERQARLSLDHMTKAISATDVTFRRGDFFQSVTPARGSVVAWPTTDETARPDYFFHWLRDSALVMNALALAIERGYADKSAVRHLHDFLDFSLETSRLSGRALAAKGAGKTARPELYRYLRSNLELEAVEGDRVLAEARYNADGTLDILKWARPQIDGAALRALLVLRHLPLLEGDHASRAKELLKKDLAFAARHAGDPCYDLWERRFGHHYHTRVAILAALRRGAGWARGDGRAKEADDFDRVARGLARELDHHWSEQGGFYLAAIKSSQGVAEGDLDAAVLLALVNAPADGRHSLVDPRAQATLERLEDMFARLFPVNGALKQGEAPLMGRFLGDSYFGGGVFLMCALAAAELYYRLAGHVRKGGRLRVESDNRRFLARCGLAAGDLALDALPGAESERLPLAAAFWRKGDSIMAAIRRFTPPSGELPEQLDKASGAPASAANLAWSHAAFITAFVARGDSLC